MVVITYGAKLSFEEKVIKKFCWNYSNYANILEISWLSIGLVSTFEHEKKSQGSSQVEWYWAGNLKI